MSPLRIELHDEVHPIWREERFLRKSRCDYLLLAARLATRLIQSPGAEHHLYAVLFGTLEEVNHSDTQDSECKRRKQIRATFAEPNDMDVEGYEQSLNRSLKMFIMT